MRTFAHNEIYMILVFFIFIFLLGIVIGSFLGVVVDRSIEDKSIVSGRSACDHCRHKLSWLELIPVLSYIGLGGRCRSCHAKISLYYPVIEILTGLLFFLTVFSILGTSIFFDMFDIRYLFVTSYFLYIISSLVIVFFADLKYGIIPFKIVFAAIIITFLWYFLLPILHLQNLAIPFLALEDNYLFTYLISGLGALSFFFLIFLATKGKGMGFGDVVYAFLMGFILGFPNIVLGLYIAFLTGAFVAILLVLFRIKKLKGGSVPFGPFLILGTVISLFWGKPLIAIILRLLGV